MRRAVRSPQFSSLLLFLFASGLYKSAAPLWTRCLTLELLVLASCLASHGPASRVPLILRNNMLAAYALKRSTECWLRRLKEAGGRAGMGGLWRRGASNAQNARICLAALARA